jgi:hypothetical protein
MIANDRLTPRLIEEMGDLVRRAPSAQDAVGCIAGVLETAVPSLWRGSVSKLVEDDTQLECMVVWSRADSMVKPGLRVSKFVTTFPEMVRLGRPLVASESKGPTSNLKRVLMSERTHSWVAIPMRDGDAITGMLGFSGDEPGAFAAADVPFYAELGRAVELPLLALI